MQEPKKFNNLEKRLLLQKKDFKPLVQLYFPIVYHFSTKLSLFGRSATAAGLCCCWHLIPKINPRNQCRVPRLHCSERRKAFPVGYSLLPEHPACKTTSGAAPRLPRGPPRASLSSAVNWRPERVRFGEVPFHLHLLVCPYPSPEMEHYTESKSSDGLSEEGCVGGDGAPAGPPQARGQGGPSASPRPTCAFSSHRGSPSVIPAAPLLAP